MSTSKPSSITIEEAVARMINLEYIPTGFTLLEMIWAFQEEAEVEYENARIDRLPKDQIAKLKIRLDVCQTRHLLAQLLLEDLRHESTNPEGSVVILSNDSSVQPRLTLESVSEWASYKYGIGIPEWSHADRVTDDKNESVKNVPWEDVTIKIYVDHRIAFSIKGGKYKKSTFQKIGLMGQRKNEPNLLGDIFIRLGIGDKYPKGRIAASKDKTAISKLRDALVKLTGISRDPFSPFNAADGWKPRFRLIDDRRNADERAKDKATHVSYKEARDFDVEDDEAGEFLKNNR